MKKKTRRKEIGKSQSKAREDRQDIILVEFLLSRELDDSTMFLYHIYFQHLKIKERIQTNLWCGDMFSILSWLFNYFVNNPLITLILAIYTGVLGLVFFLIFSSTLKSNKISQSWPRTPGIITTSHVEKRKVARMGGRHGLQHLVRYIPFIKYSYTVNGINYEGERIGYGINQSAFESAPKRWVKRFPKQSIVQVHYDPATPQESVLVTGTINDIAGFIFSLFFSLTGILLTGIWVCHFFVK